MVRLFALTFLALVVCASFAFATAPEGYVIDSSVALDPSQSGVSGFLQTLRDARITNDMRKTMWGSSNAPDLTLSKRERDRFGKAPIRKARLRLIDRSGLVLAEEEFEYNLAEIGVAHLYGTRFPTYLVTVDQGFGVGTYRGPATVFAEVRLGRLAYLKAAEDGGERMSLVRSVKYGWRIVASARGPAKEIEAVASVPDFTDDEPDRFAVIYSTYRFDGRQWHHASRRELGFWEDAGDGSWPDRAHFP